MQYRNMNMKPHKHATYLRLLSLKESMWQASDILKVFREGVLSCVGKISGGPALDRACHGPEEPEQDGNSDICLAVEATSRIGGPFLGLRQTVMVLLSATSSSVE